MSNEPATQTDFNEPLAYQIRLKGHLGREWADWFGGLTITLDENGETLITGPALDQAALYGLLKKVRDLGLPLVSVNYVEPCPERRSKGSSRGADPSATLGTSQADVPEEKTVKLTSSVQEKEQENEHK